MRVLLINPGYEQNFWSFERVLKRLGKKVAQPPLGLITLAALLPRSWEFRLVEEFAGPLAEQDLVWAEVVMVTGISTQCQRMLANLRRARQAGKITVAGGPLAYHIPQVMLEAGAQVVVKGEAELLVDELVLAIETGKEGLVLESEAKPDLKESPVPRYDLLDLNFYLDMSAQFSRGCPFECEFCDITMRLGRRVRTKTPRQFLAELQALYDLGWRRNVFVVDDNFIGDRGQARQLLLALIPWMKERGYPFDFMTQASLNLAKEPELMALMVEAGFNRVFLGVETTDRQSLASIGKRQNLAQDLDEACRAINSAGLMIMAACILGFDHEAAGAGKRFVDFIRRNNIPDVFATLLQAVPGTALHSRLLEEGRFSPIEWEKNVGGQTSLCNFLTTRPQAEIVEEIIELFTVLFDQRNYVERLANHLAAMPPLPKVQTSRRPYLCEVKAVLQAILFTGLAQPQRWRFWRQVGRGWLYFPSRMNQFWAGCLLAEHNKEHLLTIRQELRQRLAEDERHGLIDGRRS